MRPAQYFALWPLAMGVAGPALAQTSPPLVQTAQAAPATRDALTDPAAPSAALRHTPLAATPAPAEADGDWRAAHGTGAAFPRGHADLLAWEAAQTHAQPPAPMHGHGHHHGPAQKGQP